MQYRALAKGLANRQLVPITFNLSEVVQKNPEQDYYTSLYIYKDHHFDQFKKTRSLAGIKDVTTNKLIFDFDSEQDIAIAKTDTIELCNRLIKNGIDLNSMNIFFSGGKGFHVDVLLDLELTRQQFVNIVFGLASDLRTFDTTINDEQRIVRVPLSKHPKTKLYKIPLSFSDLKEMTIDEIKESAKENIYDIFEPRIQSLSESLNNLKNTNFKKTSKESALIIDLDFDSNGIDWSQCPKWLTKDRFVLQSGYFRGSGSAIVGQRNRAFMILAAFYKNQGFSAEHTVGLLMATAKMQAKRTGENQYTEDQIRKEIISEVFSSNWKGGIYGKDDELLQAIREHFNIPESVVKSDVVDITAVGSEFKSFAKNIDRNTIKTGLKSLDDKVLLTSGMMVTLLASPGAGKTSFASLFVEHLSKLGEQTLFFSLDMYQPLLFNRLLQRYAHYPMEKILNMYKANEPDETLVNAYNDVLKNYSNVHFNFRTGPTLEDIEREIIEHQDRTGKPIKLLVIDYLEKLRGPFADSTANTAYIASRLSDFAKKYHLTLLLLVQPAKSAGDPRDDLNSYRKIKGSSVLEQDSRCVLTLSRPGYNPSDSSNDKYACISVVKNNMGPLAKIDFRFDGLSGSFTELDNEGRRDLMKLRQNIEEEKANLVHSDDGITPSFTRSSFRK